MDNKETILKHCAEAHSLAEQSYLEHPATKESPDWLDKRKYLLADLSVHLVQAALKKDSADADLIKRSLFAVLTVCADFIPEADLATTANKLIDFKN